MVDQVQGVSPRYLFLAVMCLGTILARGFDIRRHLGTKTRYAYRLAVPGAPSIYKAPDPDGYDAVHLYLVARHGTRWPTGDRMRQINELEALFRDSSNTADHPWLRNWTAPFSNVGLMGGELHPIGADELWGLAYRLRKRFPSLSSQEYLPKRFPVVSTQVARTAASASAFTSGFFPDVGSGDPADDSRRVNPAPPAAPVEAAGSGGPGLGMPRSRRGRTLAEGAAAVDLGASGQMHSLNLAVSDSASPSKNSMPYMLLDELDETLRDQPRIRRPQAVAMSMAPKGSDPLLRFFEVCPAYAQHDEYTEKWMSSWMQGNWSRLAPALERRLGLTRAMSPCEVEGLWQLCLLEAGLYGLTDQACSLFEPEEAMMLEWVDDIHLLETQSYGAPINYDIAAPLLRDAADTLAAVAAAAGRSNGDGDTESEVAAPAARLLFAHCETLVPLASLLGLFQPPTPLPPPDATPEQVDAAVSAAAAQRHLQQVDTLEDLQVLVERLQDLNGRPQQRGPGAGTGGGPLGADDLHACYKGRPIQPGGIAPPEGWSPPLPNDDSRVFKGARIGPFGANLALVVYRRRLGGGAPSGRPAHLVRLLYNEQVLPVPGCGDDVDCDLDRFLDLIKDKIKADTLDRLCARGGGSDAGAGQGQGDGGASRMFEVMGSRRKRVQGPPDVAAAS